jgi:molybdopterin synthase sulfur carrier subunit
MVFAFTKHQHQRRLSKFIKMTITIKYFGRIADITNKNEEEFISEDTSLSTGSLINNLQLIYADLRNATYVLAVNETITKVDLQLKNSDIIALLPPFAGG